MSALPADETQLERLAEVVPGRPVLDHLAILDPPEDLLGRELPAGRRPAQELADVAAVHGEPATTRVARRSLVVDDVEMDQLVRRIEVAPLVKLARQPAGDERVLRSHLRLL